MMISVLCPVSVLSHSVESCGTSLTRPGIVFHKLNVVLSLGLLVIFHLIFMLRRYGFVLSQGVKKSPKLFKFLQNSLNFSKIRSNFAKIIEQLNLPIITFYPIFTSNKIFLSRRVFNKKVQIFPVDIAINRCR